MQERIAIYPGTFDPLTLGHLDIIERASKLFDKIIITIASNSRKQPLFSLEERIRFIKDATRDISNVSVENFEGLLVDFAVTEHAVAIIRGLRAVSDFEYELQMALMNRRLNRDVTTVFLMPNEKYTYLNSTIVKEVARYGGNIENFVTPMVAEKLLEKLKKG
jgi:pantetheine-phosphate adenylyltransferase